jgi:hypothetical protein
MRRYRDAAARPFRGPGYQPPGPVIPPENAGPLGPPRVPGAPATPRQTLTARGAGNPVGKTPYTADGKDGSGLTSPCSRANSVAPARVDTPSLPYTRWMW